MGQFILRRLLGLIPTLLIIVTVAFFVIRLAPGSPFSSERAVPPEVLQDLKAKYGFDQPLTVQYVRYVADNLLGMLGVEKLYHVECPFDFMSTLGLQEKTNFFEHRSTEYQLSGATAKAESHVFDLETDF